MKRLSASGFSDMNAREGDWRVSNRILVPLTHLLAALTLALRGSKHNLTYQTSGEWYEDCMACT